MKLASLAMMSLLVCGVAFAAASAHVVKLKKDCDGGDAWSCVALAEMYDFDTMRELKHDYFKAVEYYRKGCDGGNAEGCNNLGAMYNEGQGVRQSKAEALKYFGKACDLKYQDGCTHFAELKAGKPLSRPPLHIPSSSL